MSEQDPFEARVSRLVNYLIRAHKHNKPSILFALYLSEFLRTNVESSLDKSLKEQGIGIVAVDAGKNKDIPAVISSSNSKETVFLVHNLEKAFPEALKFLNFKREELVDNKVKVVFWVKEEELARITLEAPDFFAFRNRVVEFMEPFLADERRPALVDFALETEYKSLAEIKRNIELKEKLLAELSGDDEISGYLLNSLGILNNRIGCYNKSIEYSEKALNIAKENGDRHNIDTSLNNLAVVYFYMDQVDKAIEYSEMALKIAKEIGDRGNEGKALGNLGNAYVILDQEYKAIDYYEQALVIAKEIKDQRIEGITLGNLGVTYINLGQVDKAIEYSEMALKIAKEIGDRGNEAHVLGILGGVYMELGNLESIKCYRQSLVISKEIGDRRNEGIQLNHLGFHFEEENKYREALACYMLAKKIYLEIKDLNIKTTESNLESLKEKLGKVKFEKLEAEVAPKAKEIVNQILESNLY